MNELSQLFNTFGKTVLEQEQPIKECEQNSEDVKENVDKGAAEIDKAIESARSGNRKKWWCLLISLVVVAVVAVVVALVMKTKPV
jgi:syntaxin 1B/2/3